MKTFKSIILTMAIGAILAPSLYAFGALGVTTSSPVTGPAWSANQFTSNDAVTSSGENGAAYDQLAIDGNNGTGWNSNAAAYGSIWWKYDLGDGYAHHINRIFLLDWTGLEYGYEHFKVQGSTNDSTWVDLVSGTSSSGFGSNFDFTDNTTVYRYIRIILTADNAYTTATYGAQINEIRAYYYE